MDRNDSKELRDLAASLRKKLEEVAPGASKVMVMTDDKYQESFSRFIEMFLPRLGLLEKRISQVHEVLPALRKRNKEIKKTYKWTAVDDLLEAGIRHSKAKQKPEKPAESPPPVKTEVFLPPLTKKLKKPKKSLPQSELTSEHLKLIEDLEKDLPKRKRGRPKKNV